MARPYWSGQITISLVSFSVKLFVATEAKGEIRFHQISRSTGERVKYQKVSASAQEAQQNSGDDAPAAPTVRQDDIVKGYEYTKGKYVLIEPKELTKLRVPSKHTMEVTQFVDEAEIDPEYYEKPYFVMPEDDTQAQAFAVVRQALLDTKKIAISKIAFGGREHIVAIAPAADAGMMAYTMRYASELRDAKDYFRDIKRVEPEEESLELAKMLIQRKSAKFEPQKFVDGYEVALKELVQAKIDHAPIPKDEAPAAPRGKVVSLMDALRKSIGSEPQEEALPRKKPAARHGTAAAEGITLVPGKAAPKTARRKSA
jgi:DNA end-binding protein Ku